PHAVEAADRDVVLVDDIIATGGTMSEAIRSLGDSKANRVYATCVHAMLARNARNRLARAGVEAIFGTDTIERPESAVTVAPVIADAV
ncbi:MAG: phosphoribosyltransferase family protein, partial [Halobacteriales archaeon]|nr:phosphoribosyltransferase family protein [Halobacteriales archaeon]